MTVMTKCLVSANIHCHITTHCVAYGSRLVIQAAWKQRRDEHKTEQDFDLGILASARLCRSAVLIRWRRVSLSSDSFY